LIVEAGTSDFHHRPVLIREVVDMLRSAGEGEIMDGTAGGGGHSLALLEAFPLCRILAVDRDPEALHAARARLDHYQERVEFVQDRFDRVLERRVSEAAPLDGILLDLGVSGHQLDVDSRGFTFRPDAPLDMRMEVSAAGQQTAAELLNHLSEEELIRIFREYGEEPQARRLARAVTLLRGDREFRVADDLTEAMAKAYRRSPSVKDKARIFQSLRIEVNSELESLDRALAAAEEVLVAGGVLVVISYHSLEDRRVKRAIQGWSEGCICPPGLPVCGCGFKPSGEAMTRRVVRPGEEELGENPRARSARLRAWRKAA
jgi:16S rRNA (cytosine1402-N4)-methyltransferase